MQPWASLPEENMFVAMQRDNLPPPRVTTAMNIGRGRAIVARSMKKAKTTIDGVHTAETSGTRRGRWRAGRTEEGRKKGAWKL